MAAGDTLLILGAQGAVPTATIFGTQDTIAGGSTPVEAFPVIDFSGTVTWYVDFSITIPNNYSGGNGMVLTVIALYPTTTGGVRWEAAFRLCADDAEQVTASHTYDYNGVSVTTLPSAINEPGYHDITFTAGADCDSVVAGSAAILRVRRVFDHSDDTMSGDASLWLLHLKQAA